MTTRALIFTTLFSAACFGSFVAIVHYADALESNKPHTLVWVRTYKFQASPTKLNCQVNMDRQVREAAANPDDFTDSFQCVPEGR